MVGNKSANLDKYKNLKPADYCSLCGCQPRQVVDHDRAHAHRNAGRLYESLKYLRPLPKFSDKGFPEDYVLKDGKTINPKYLIGRKKI